MMDNITYEILSGDMVVAKSCSGILTVTDEKLLPLYLKNFPDIDSWLATRAIDSHRANSRLLKKALRMKERDDVATVLRANGVTVTDNYWVREAGSALTYQDVCFDEAYFRKKSSKSAARLALTGSTRSFNYITGTNATTIAELTNTGSFEKCWKNINGMWWLYKVANRHEAFSEVFIYNLCRMIGISCAAYELVDNKVVRTLDFADGNYNFEPAFAFMGDDEDYSDTVDKLNALCPFAVPDYIKMIFLDALVFNPDRHTANFGLLRDKTNGEYIGLAPCFDHNMALISKGYPQGKTKRDLLIELFCDIINENPEFGNYIPAITQETLEEAYEKTGIKENSSAIFRYILERYEIIRSGICFR